MPRRSPTSWSREAPASIALSGRWDRRAELRASGRGRVPTGPTSTCTSATSGGCRSTIPTRTRGWCSGSSSRQVTPRSHHPMFAAGLDHRGRRGGLRALLRDVGPVDLVHLGLGPDGHTASLFPGSPALDETHHRVVVNGDALHPHPRLTVTYPWLETARLVVFTVAGVEKRDAFAEDPRRRRPSRRPGPRRARRLARRLRGTRLTALGSVRGRCPPPVGSPFVNRRSGARAC